MLYSKNEPCVSALEQGSEPIPATGLRCFGSSCSTISLLIVSRLLRAQGGDGAPPPGAAGARLPAALPSPCQDSPDERGEIMTESLAVAEEDDDYNGGDYSPTSQILQ